MIRNDDPDRVWLILASYKWADLCWPVIMTDRNAFRLSCDGECAREYVTSAFGSRDFFRSKRFLRRNRLLQEFSQELL